MIKADLHLHTCFSHGEPTPMEVHALATARHFTVIGFSEHSPRPLGYNYRHEYRDRLAAHLEDYRKQVLALKKNAITAPTTCQTLFGMEMDWFPAEREFVEKACRWAEFDYLLGSVHFLGNWGFDDSAEDWQNLSQEECDRIYDRYFADWRDMIASGLFDIASHPDLIKIFSVERFHIWLQRPESRAAINSALKLLKSRGMAMEISSAGLRKPCREIYPAPAILKMAAELEVPVALASDSHTLGDFGYGFEELEKTAKSHGWTKQTIFKDRKMANVSF